MCLSWFSLFDWFNPFGFAYNMGCKSIGFFDFSEVGDLFRVKSEQDSGYD